MPSPSPLEPVKPPIDIPATFAKTGDDQINHLLAPIQPGAPFGQLGQLKEGCDADRFKRGRWHQRFLRAGDDTKHLRLCSFDFRGDAGVGPIRNLGGSQVELSFAPGSNGKYIVVYEARHAVVAPYLTATVDASKMVLVSICVGEPIKPSEIDIEIVLRADYNPDKAIAAGDAINLGFEFAEIKMAPR